MLAAYPSADERLLITAYRPDLDVLVSRWTYQPDAGLLPATYAQLREDARAQGCRFWLQDIRRRTVNDPQITEWLLSTYLPELGQELGGQLCVAYLTSPALMQSLVNGPGYLPPEGYAGRPFVVAFFGDEGEAIRWLHEQQKKQLG